MEADIASILMVKEYAKQETSRSMLTLWPWRWRWYTPLKHWPVSEVHSVEMKIYYMNKYINIHVQNIYLSSITVIYTTKVWKIRCPLFAAGHFIQQQWMCPWLKPHVYCLWKLLRDVHCFQLVSQLKCQCHKRHGLMWKSIPLLGVWMKVKVTENFCLWWEHDTKKSKVWSCFTAMPMSHSNAVSGKCWSTHPIAQTFCLGLQNSTFLEGTLTQMQMIFNMKCVTAYQGCAQTFTGSEGTMDYQARWLCWRLTQIRALLTM
jgi:hypothetical protein